MIFPHLKTEKILQVNDQTRLSAEKTLVNDGDVINTITITPENGEAAINVLDNDNYSLDWVYKTAGLKNVVVTINGTETISSEILVVTENEDKLFSNDEDLVGIESDILNYCNSGRVTHLDRHREAQRHIFSQLYARGVRDVDGNRIGKDNILDTQELKEWSKYYTLYLIYNDNKNDPEGILAEKSKLYKSLAENASTDRQFIKLDLDNDGESEETQYHFTSTTLVRR